MCHKCILENNKTLKSVPDCYQIHEMCNKAVDDYFHVLEFVPEFKDCIIKLLILILLQ